MDIKYYKAQLALVVKNLPTIANAGEGGHAGLIRGSGRSSGGEWYSCLENPWTEETGRLQSIRSQRVGHD